MTPDLFTVAAEPVVRAATKATRGKRVEFYVYDCPDGSARIIKPCGRDAWAPGELVFAGADGCTPIDNPGPRWSGYVFKLKRIYGLDIETITEMHGGPDPADAARCGGDQ